jgi:hypothetical protein
LSRIISIFIEHPQPVAKLATLLEPILAVRFKHFTNDNPGFFEARTNDSIIVLSTHDYDNDRDLNFEDYSYELQFRPIRDELFKQRELAALSRAKNAFADIRQILNPNMILVDDLQRKLDSNGSVAENRPAV